MRPGPYSHRQRDDQTLKAIAVRIPEELARAVKHVCIENGRSLTYIVERSLINYLADNYPDYLPERWER